MDPPPAKAEAAAAASPPGKQEKATTLLDVQEVEWIMRELERLLAREQQSRSSEGVDDAGAAGRHRRKRSRISPTPVAHKVGFLADILGRHAVSICSGDAVDHSSATAGHGTRRRRGGRGSFREVEKV